MPIGRTLRGDLREIRTFLNGDRIAQVLFAIEAGELPLLHGFPKKIQRTLPEALRPAEQRPSTHRG